MNAETTEPPSMGRVITEATIENLEDIWAAKRGLLPADDVRRISVSDALVDTGAILTFCSTCSRPSSALSGSSAV